MIQDYEQQQSPQMPYPSTGMSNLHAESGALQYQLENQDAADMIEHIIRGEVRVVNKTTGAVEWVQSFQPMLNERGLDMVKGYLYTYLGTAKTFALSEFSKDYIADQTISVGRIIRSELQDNWKNYGVRDYSSASFIIDTITSIVYATLMKGHDGNYLKFLRTTQTIQEVQHHQQTSMTTSKPSLARRFAEKIIPFK